MKHTIFIQPTEESPYHSMLQRKLAYIIFRMQVTVVMVRQATCLLSVKLEESIAVYLWGKPV